MQWRRGRRMRPAVRRVLLAVGPVLALVLLAELALRLAGYASPDEDPYASFVRHEPLFVRDGAVCRTRPARVGHFAAQSFPVAKPEGTLRVFVLGGSVVHGYGLTNAPRDGVCARLRSGLRAATGRAAEVINCGGISYASYRLVGIAEECLQYEPDLMVVLSGHNEFLEARHDADLKAQTATTPRWRRSRLLTAAAELGARRKAERTQDALPDNPPPLLSNEAIDERYIVRDAGEAEATRAHFEHNLARIRDACVSNGVPVVFGTLPANLRDWPPFYSVLDPRVPLRLLEEQQQRIERALRGREYGAARTWSRDILKVMPDAAIFRWYEGRALLGLRKTAAARQAFVQARDTDAFPHRATTRLNDTVRRVAAGAGVMLIDLERLFEREAPDGIPGEELFLDQCHPNARGHAVLATGLVLGVAPDLRKGSPRTL